MDEVKGWQWASAVLIIVAIIVLVAQILGPFFIHEFAIGVFYIPAILSLGVYLYLARRSDRHSA